MSFNSVQLFRENQEWVVLVVENGDETRERFGIEDHARSWAAGQCKRLGLPVLKSDGDGLKNRKSGRSQMG